MLSEVSLAHDPMNLQPILVYTDPLGDALTETVSPKNNTWMFPIAGSYEAARSVMVVLGRAGAYRANFLNEFTLDPEAIAQLSVNGSCWAIPTGAVSEVEPGAVLVTLRTTASGSEEEAAMRREILALVRSQGHPNIMDFQGFFFLWGPDQWGNTHPYTSERGVYPRSGCMWV